MVLPSEKKLAPMLVSMSTVVMESMVAKKSGLAKKSMESVEVMESMRVGLALIALEEPM